MTEPAASTEPRAPGVPGSAGALRHVMGQFETGVTVVSAQWAGVAHAMTATAVCSVSLDPPLVLVCVSKTSRFHEAITQAGRWAMSILAAEQEPLARHFSHKGRDLLTQFRQVATTAAPYSAAPLLDGCLAWLDCRTYAQHDGGDHTIVIGEVRHASEEPVEATRLERAPAAGASAKSSPGHPLTYYRGAYRT